MVDPVEQKFNDDLLLTAEDRENAKEAFGPIFHVIDNPELRASFVEYDEPAGRHKRRSHLAGIFAVFLVVVGLSISSGESVYKDWWPATTALSIARAAAVFALLGGLMGLFNIMTGTEKRRWLCQRLAGERLRQFHFQDFVCNAGEILVSLSGQVAKNEFIANRSARLATFKKRLVSHLESELNALVFWGQGSDVWIEHLPRALGETNLNALPEQYFRAYCTLRIMHQQKYAEWKLRYGRLMSLRALEMILWYGGLVMALALIGTEIAIVFLLPWMAPTDQAVRYTIEVDLHWAAIGCAVLALGLRTLEEGLHAKRELERYTSYRSRIKDVLLRYETGSRAEKFEAMIEMEQLAFEEFRDFLSTADGSRFVM
jgi:hypothetical protein